MRWKLASRPERSPKFVADAEPSIPPRTVEGAELRLTLVNHSTFLIQANGVNILTDPMWSERASPVGWAGPRRHRAPGIRWEDLPPIDLVLLSHDHYDHLDVPTLTRLATEHSPEFVAPLRVGAFLDRNAIGPVHEMDWEHTDARHGVAIHCVPAIHFSGRTAFDRNKTLWCGYVLETGAGNIYFAGDTAMGDHFAGIRKRFGEIAVALLPIGAYRPRWFMCPVHMNPEEALRAHHILGARTSIAMHHGTFQLSDESIDAPAKELRLREKRRHGEQPFVILRNGESLAWGKVE